MSDYLYHLVARTLSPEVGVRPQLRSAFEPAPLHDGFTVPTDFESETLVESNPPIPPPPASLPLIAPLPVEHGPLREYPTLTPAVSPARLEAPRQDATPAQPNPLVGEMPFADRNEGQDIAPVQPLPLPLPEDREPSIKLTELQQVIHAPPDSYPENILAVATPPSTSRPDPIPMPHPFLTAPTSGTVHPASAVVPNQTVKSEEPRAERVPLVAIRSVAPAASAILPSRSAAPTSDARHPAPVIVPSRMVEPEEPRAERLAVAAIRSVAPAAPVFSPSRPIPPGSDSQRPASAVIPSQKVVSEEPYVARFAVAAIRPVASAAPVLLPSLSPAVAPPPPSIHVTIGRVEVRAAPPPPAPARAKATLPSVISLEEYLGRRSAGGQR